jgi:hypothetical protein
MVMSIGVFFVVGVLWIKFLIYFLVSFSSVPNLLERNSLPAVFKGIPIFIRF